MKKTIRTALKTKHPPCGARRLRLLNLEGLVIVESNQRTAKKTPRAAFEVVVFVFVGVRFMLYRAAPDRPHQQQLRSNSSVKKDVLDLFTL